MHHYGEDAVKVSIMDSAFVIVLTNHHTGVPIVITGPIKGVLENAGDKIDKIKVQQFGEEIAHLARRILA